jgi:hypothetical protein
MTAESVNSASRRRSCEDIELVLARDIGPVRDLMRLEEDERENG